MSFSRFDFEEVSTTVPTILIAFNGQLGTIESFSSEILDTVSHKLDVELTERNLQSENPNEPKTS